MARYATALHSHSRLGNQIVAGAAFRAGNWCSTSLFAVGEPITRQQQRLPFCNDGVFWWSTTRCVPAPMKVLTLAPSQLRRPHNFSTPSFLHAAKQKHTTHPLAQPSACLAVEVQRLKPRFLHRQPLPAAAPCSYFDGAVKLRVLRGHTQFIPVRCEK